MAWIDLVARKFADVLRDPNFRVESGGPYPNEYGVMGWRYSRSLNGRLFYISESKTSIPTPLQKLARIISESEHLDRRHSVVYANRDFGLGVRVEAWYCGTWFQVFTPNVANQPADDFFARLALEHPDVLCSL